MTCHAQRQRSISVEPQRPARFLRFFAALSMTCSGGGF